MGNPYLEIRDGQTRHPFPINYKQKKLVLISSCGLWEIEHFDSMLYHLNAISKNLDLVSAGTLLRPHSYAMRECDIMDILAASKKAGREIAEAGYISSETQSTISREILFKTRLHGLINTRADTLLNPDSKIFSESTSSSQKILIDT